MGQSSDRNLIDLPFTGGYPRTYQTITNLSSAEGLKIGDTLTVSEHTASTNYGGGVFEVTNDSIPQYTKYEAEGSQSLNISGANYNVTANSLISVKFRIDALQGSNGSQLEFIRFREGANFRGLFYMVNQDPYFRIYPTTGAIHDIKDKYGYSLGTLEERKTMVIGEWYEVILNPSATAVIDKIVVGGDSTHTDCSVEWINVDGDLFPMNEAMGTSITSEGGEIGDLINGATWAEQTIYYDNATYLKIDNKIVKKLLPNGVVTPLDYGAILNPDFDTFDNDSTAAIQAALDSPNPVEIPNGFYYITDTLYFRVRKEVKMFGNHSLGQDLSKYSDEASTIIYSDQNIDYFNVRVSDMITNNGIIYTGNSVGHNKAAIKLDANYNINKCDINNISIIGSIDTVKTAGLGTIAIYMNSDALTRVGFLHDINVSGNITYCNYGVYLPDRNTSAYGNWWNTHTYNLNMHSCKRFFHLYNISTVKINSSNQDNPVSPLADLDWAGYFNGSDIELDMFSYDKVDEESGFYGHLNKSIKLTGSLTNKISGKSWIEKRNNTINFDGWNVNHEQIIIDPSTHALTRRKGNISRLENAIASLGESGTVTYKGFESPGVNWFDANLLPSDNVGNATPLTESVNITISNGSNLLTSGRLTPSHLFGAVASQDLAFAEIYLAAIPNVSNASKIKELYISKNLGDIKEIQTIITFSDATQLNTRVSNDSGSYFIDKDTFRLWSGLDDTYKNKLVTSILIRLIGQETGVTTDIDDIFLRTQYDDNLPYGVMSGDGLLLKDRATSTKYRLYIDNGVITSEAI